MNFAAIREEYQGEPLDTSTVHPDPIEQFRLWFDETLEAGIYQPNAMTLATATPDGDPSARMVLLKGFDAHGFVFFTNYLSRKGRELASNPRAALVFYWEELHRQVVFTAPSKPYPLRKARNTSRPGPTKPASAPPPPTSPAPCLPEPISRRESPKSATLTPSKCPVPTTGAATVSPPIASSSGRAGKAVCMTVCNTSLLLRAGGA
ncbi:MAG: pyridoxamine 5'-phosphate oxidase family protein [Bryobacteraceae bacterium]